jgi:predicted nucleic acid-binding protein
MNIFIDTNVLLDVMLCRDNFYPASRTVSDIVETNKINAFVSAVSMTTIFYILRKFKPDISEVYSLMDDLSALFTVAPVTEYTITNAMALRWKDFEDAVQFISAQGVNAQYIITRNKADFETPGIPCLNPDEYSTQYKNRL